MEDKDYRRAQAYVQDIRAFYIHFSIYILVNILLITLNVVTSWGTWWFYWVTIFWGIGVVIHGASVWGENHFLGKEWEERRIQQILDKEKK